MNSDWQHLVYDAQDNLGGTRRVRCAPLHSFVPPLPGPNTGNVVQVEPTWDSDDTWLYVQFTTDKATFSEKEKQGAGGPEWEVSVQGFLPYDSAAQRSQLEDMVRYRWVVEAQDNNDVWRRIGNLRNPARLTVDFSTDSSTTGARGYTLQWKWMHDRPAPMVELDPGLDGTYTEVPGGQVNLPGEDT